MSTPLAPDQPEPAYITMWFYLERPLPSPVADASRVALATAHAAGIKTLNEVTAYHVRENPGWNDTQHETWVRKKVPVDSDPTALGGNPPDGVFGRIVFEGRQRGSRDDIDDYLFRCLYISRATYPQTNFPAPRFSFSVRTSLFANDDGRLMDFVEQSVDRVAAGMSIVSGFIELGYASVIEGGHRMSPIVDVETTFERAREYCIWNHPDARPCDMIFRIDWGTVIGPRLMKKLDEDADIVESFNRWPRGVKGYSQTDVQFPQSARRLSDGSGLFYLRSRTPLQFLGDYPNHFRFAAHGGSPSNTLPLAAWFHWQLRNRNMLM